MSNLCLAVEQGDSDKIETLIRWGFDVNWQWKMNKNTTALIIASSKGYTGIIELLIQNGVDLTLTNTNGYNALHIAIENGHTDAVRVLIAAGANVNTKVCLNTPLHLAAYVGKCEIIRMLIASGNDVNATIRYNGYTPLHCAIFSGNIEAIRILIKAGANVDAVNNKGETLLHLAVYVDTDTIKCIDNSLVKTLLEYNPNDTIRDNTNKLARDYAINNDDVLMVLDKYVYYPDDIKEPEWL